MRQLSREENHRMPPDLGRRYQVYPETGAADPRPGAARHIMVSVASGAITAEVVALILNI